MKRQVRAQSRHAGKRPALRLAGVSDHLEGFGVVSLAVP